MSTQPFIVRNLFNPQTGQHVPTHLYFDAVFPVVYANNRPSHRAEGITRDRPLHGTIITSAEYFIIRQLWPESCAVDEAAALSMLEHPGHRQLSLFGGNHETETVRDLTLVSSLR